MSRSEQDAGLIGTSLLGWDVIGRGDDDHR